VLIDNDALASFVQTQLLYGISMALEAEVLSGDGGANHLQGILSTTGVQQQGFVQDELTTLRTAITSLEVIGYEAKVFVLNSEDWAALETARNESGQFDLGSPVNRAERRIWGAQVVTSPKIERGTALVLDLSALNVDAGSEGIHIEWDGSGALFEKNQVRARVEGRFGLSVTLPAGIVSIDLTAGQ
jgi:HK97 family phage major capsid protein